MAAFSPYCASLIRYFLKRRKRRKSDPQINSSRVSSSSHSNKVPDKASLKIREVDESALKKFIEDADKLNISAIKPSNRFKKRQYNQEKTGVNTMVDGSIASFAKECKKMGVEKRYSNEKMQVDQPPVEQGKVIKLEQLLHNQSEGYITESDDMGMKEDFSYFGDSVSLEEVQEERPVRLIETANELADLLSGRTLNALNQKLKLQLKTIIFEGDSVEIIDADCLILILKAIYDEFHASLLEVNDQFCDERRQVFEENFDAYLKCIAKYLKRKEELFQCVFSNILSKLELNDDILDASLQINIKTNETKKAEIESSFSRIYKAGIKLCFSK